MQINPNATDQEVIDISSSDDASVYIISDESDDDEILIRSKSIRRPRPNRIHDPTDSDDDDELPIRSKPIRKPRPLRIDDLTDSEDELSENLQDDYNIGCKYFLPIILNLKLFSFN